MRGESWLGTRSSRAGGWGHTDLPGGAGGGARGRQESCAPFLQHHLALTGRFTAFHFRWKSLVLHLWVVTCRYKPTERLKNSHRDFWLCWTSLDSLEGSETRMKFGRASSCPQTPLEHILFIPKLLQKTCTLSLRS